MIRMSPRVWFSEAAEPTRWSEPRDWWALGLPNPCHRRDPRLLLWRIRHRLTGPRRGCSCSRCFRHPKRIARSNEVIDRFVRLEKRVLELEQREIDRRCREFGSAT